MKPDYWRRLVRTARQAPPAARPEMPFGFDQRLLAGLRGQKAVSESLPWNALLRGALACSAAVMLLALCANFWTTRAADQNALAAADSVVTLSLLQSR